MKLEQRPVDLYILFTIVYGIGGGSLFKIIMELVFLHLFQLRSLTWKFCIYVLSRVWLFETPGTVAQVLLSMGFLSQEYWHGLPFPTQRYLPDPGIEPMSLVSLALAGRFLTTVPPGKPWKFYQCDIILDWLWFVLFYWLIVICFTGNKGRCIHSSFSSVHPLCRELELQRCVLHVPFREITI